MPKPKLTRHDILALATPPARSVRRGCWALLVIDQEPVRQRATRAYREAGDRLAELRAVIEHFSTKDQPAFGNWLAGSFGTLLTELRELGAQIEEVAFTLDAIQMMTAFGRVSPHEAYQEIMRRKDEEERRGAGGLGGDDDDGDWEDGSFEDDDPMKEFFEDVREAFGASEEPKPRAKADPEPPPRRDARARKQNPPEDATGQRLKAAYRAVVRRLHPDLNPDLTDYDCQLWHDAQQAYEKADLERLETILAVCELERAGGWPTGSSLGGLLALTRQLGASALRLEKQRRELKKLPGWGFAGLNTKGRTALKQQVGARLRNDLVRARAELADLEADLAFCRQSPRRQPGRAASRKKGR